MDTADISQFQTALEQQPKPKPPLPPIAIGQGVGGGRQDKHTRRKYVHRVLKVPPDLKAVFDADPLLRRLRAVEAERMNDAEEKVKLMRKRIEAINRTIYNIRRGKRIIEVRDRIAKRQALLAQLEADRIITERRRQVHREFGLQTPSAINSIKTQQSMTPHHETEKDR